MGKPRPALRGVHPELLETALQPTGERRRLAAPIGEDEHADGARLPVAHRLELERSRRGSLVAQRAQDRLEGAPRLSAEEGQRDVEALHPPDVCSPMRGVQLAPADELRDDVVGELERQEEPEAFISIDGSRSAHAGV